MDSRTVRHAHWKERARYGFLVRTAHPTDNGAPYRQWNTGIP